MIDPKNVGDLMAVLNSVFAGRESLEVASAIWGSTDDAVKWWLHDCVDAMHDLSKLKKPKRPKKDKR
jgi:hypothetical protein